MARTLDRRIFLAPKSTRAAGVRALEPLVATVDDVAGATSGAVVAGPAVTESNRVGVAQVLTVDGGGEPVRW